jgi:hypothetical protein
MNPRRRPRRRATHVRAGVVPRKKEAAMYGIPEVSNNRLPKTQTRGDATPPSVTHVVGTALVQAAAVVVVAKIVDAVIEAFMSRRRARQEQVPQRGRREEHAAV